jgi:hypothetical protein
MKKERKKKERDETFERFDGAILSWLKRRRRRRRRKIDQPEARSTDID